jgi:hypothetical protein
LTKGWRKRAGSNKLNPLNGSVLGNQLSVVGYQLSVNQQIGCRQSVISYQLSVIGNHCFFLNHLLTDFQTNSVDSAGIRYGLLWNAVPEFSRSYASREIRAISPYSEN